MTIEQKIEVIKLAKSWVYTESHVGIWSMAKHMLKVFTYQKIHFYIFEQIEVPIDCVGNPEIVIGDVIHPVIR